ncbi:MAG: hypothetical protein IPH54_11400 [Rhodoferax sp.]|nr:hypothetical protein [Rhodoferax sp.]
MASRSVEKPGIHFCQLVENLVFRFQPRRFASLFQHVILQRKQVNLGSGKNDDGHYLRLWRAASNCARESAAEMPLP